MAEQARKKAQQRQSETSEETAAWKLKDKERSAKRIGTPPLEAVVSILPAQNLPSDGKIGNPSFTCGKRTRSKQLEETGGIFSQNDCNTKAF